jgi:hypothetical protein
MPLDLVESCGVVTVSVVTHHSRSLAFMLTFSEHCAHLFPFIPYTDETGFDATSRQALNLRWCSGSMPACHAGDLGSIPRRGVNI